MYFYSHLVKIDTLLISLDELELTDKQKEHLAKLVDSTIHHTVLDVILSQLSDEDKLLFLDKLHHSPHDKKLMEFLNEKVGGIEKKIEQAIAELKEDLHRDVLEAKYKKGK